MPLIAEVKDRNTESSEMRKVIGIAVVTAYRISQIVDIEHCALMGPGNHWAMEVQCRTLNGARDICGNVLWESLPGRYPDAKVEVKHNSVTVTLPPIQENLEVAVFGTPGENDMIRKQIAIFGPNPEKGLNWTFNAILYDDTVHAFEQVRQKERESGCKLLTARAGLFVANIEDNINIELSVQQPGWQIKGSKIKVIKSRDAWKMPEDGADFPRCSCEIVHVDESKESFICGITVSHGEETTKAEVVAIFKKTHQKTKEEAATTSSGHQKQTVGAPISNKERKKKIQEAMFISSDKLKIDIPVRSFLIVAISLSILPSLYFVRSDGCSEAVTRNGNPNATAIKAVDYSHLLETVGAHISDKERKKKIQEERLITSDQHKRAVTRNGKPNATAIIAVLHCCLVKTAGAHISDKEQKKKIQEENLFSFDQHKRVRLLPEIMILILHCFPVLLFCAPWNGCSEAVTRNGKLNATAIIAVLHWCLLKIHTEREQNVTGQDCRAKSHFCTNRKIGSNIIRRPNNWLTLNEGIGGVRANYQSRLPNQSYDPQRHRDLMARQQTI